MIKKRKLIETLFFTVLLIIIGASFTCYWLFLRNAPTLQIAQTQIETAAFMVTFYAFIVAIIAIYYARATYLNTLSLKTINQKEQILKDLIRHLYRDKVVVSAIIRDLRNNDDKFPSEEHLLKINFSEDDLYMSKFEDFFDNFNELHHLEVRFRNFNIEAGVTLEHLKKSLSIDTKEQDLKRLSNKIDGLANEVFKLLVKDDQRKIDEKKLELKKFLTEQSESRDEFHNPPPFFENMFKGDDNSILVKDTAKRSIDWLPL